MVSGDRRACGLDNASRSRRAARPAGGVRRVACMSLFMLGFAVAAVAQDDGTAPQSFPRPEPSAMGEGGWTDTRPANPASEADRPASASAGAIQQAFEEQLVAGVARPRIDLNIEFEFSSAALTASGRSDLDAAGEAMSRHFREQHFILAGHTDASGPADYNLQLSRARAEAARLYLISQFGISAESLTAQGYGESEPIENGPPERNRRVVLELVR
jgi:outer membrane protein OmpA-like peptidoglycan-associated protein